MSQTTLPVLTEEQRAWANAFIALLGGMRLEKQKPARKSPKPKFGKLQGSLAEEEEDVSDTQTSRAQLTGEGEDISRKKMIGKSRDKGFKQDIAAVIDKFIERTDELIANGPDPDLLSEAKKIEIWLEQKRDEYRLAPKEPDSAKAKQRDKKVSAIDARLDALGKFVKEAGQLANARLEKLAGMSKEDQAKALDDNPDIRGAVIASKPPAGQLGELLANSKKKDDLIKEIERIHESDADYVWQVFVASKPEPSKFAERLPDEASKQDNCIAEVLKVHRDDPDYVDELYNDLLSRQVDAEIQGKTLDQAKQNLLRSNTAAGKLIVAYLKGDPESKAAAASMQDDIKRTTANSGYLELDGEKIRDKLAADRNVNRDQIGDADVKRMIQRSVLRLVGIANAVIDAVMAKTPPRALCVSAYRIAETIETKGFDDSTKALAIGGLVVLRFVAPAIVTASAANAAKGSPMSPDETRTALLVSKAVQNLANGITTAGKEPALAPLMKGVAGRIDEVRDWLLRIAEQGRQYAT